jgi:uncharacterized protein (TIRG00374 family)
MPRHLRTVIGILLSVLLLWWALRDVSAAEVAHELRAADPVLFALSILVTLGGFGFRALRWGILLTPAHPGVRFRPRFASTVIGFAANNLLPARVGEFARAYALTRFSSVTIGASVATLVIERLLDGLVLVALLFASMAATSFPLAVEIGGVDPRGAARVVAVVMAGGTIGLFAIVLAPRRAIRLAEAIAARLLPERLRRPAVAGVKAFLDGLLVLKDGRLFATSVALAMAQWMFTAVSFLLAFRAFGIDQVPFSGAVFLQSLISLAVALPSSPGFFGPFEAAARLGLGVWSVGSAKAVSFAVGYHIGGFIPVTVMGIYYVWRYGLRWRDVRHSDEAVEVEVGAEMGGADVRAGAAGAGETGIRARAP